MILVLEPNTRPESADYRMLDHANSSGCPNVTFRVHREVGSEVTLTEIYLIGNTARADDRADAGAALRRQGRARVGAVSRARPPPAGRRPRRRRSSTTACISARTALNVFAGLCAVDSREVGRSDDEGAARPRPGLHAHGRVQAAHVAVRVPGLRRQVPAVRVRARRQVRHPRHRDGGDARIARRRDPPRARGDRQRRPASCCRSARATRRTSSC